MMLCLPFVVGSFILIAARWEVLQDAVTDVRDHRRWRQGEAQRLRAVCDGKHTEQPACAGLLQLLESVVHLPEPVVTAIPMCTAGNPVMRMGAWADGG